MNKNLQYLKYILKHKYYVAKECFKYGLIWRGLVHDLSKFLPSEFAPYREYFYNNPEPRLKFLLDKEIVTIDDKIVKELAEGIVKLCKLKFDYAWNAHQKRNKHHPQYYRLKNDDGTLRPLEMPLKYRMEMLSDWRGVSMALTGADNTIEWYKINRKKMIIAPESRKWVEDQLGLTYE